MCAYAASLLFRVCYVAVVLLWLLFHVFDFVVVALACVVFVCGAIFCLDVCMLFRLFYIAVDLACVVLI